MLKAFLSSPSTIGAIAKYSKFSIETMLSTVSWKGIRTVVEFGPGQGNITQAILDKLSAEGSLTSFELNQHFFKPYLDHLQDSRFTPIYESCDKLDNFFETESIDVIISTIPLSLLTPGVRTTLFEKSYRCLRTGGYFITGQYSNLAQKDLKPLFATTSCTREWKNLPPVCILSAQK